MTVDTSRFTTEDARVVALRRQRIIQGKRDIAVDLEEAGQLVTYPAGAELMHQGGRDSDCYFILSGRVEMRVNGDTLPYKRGANELVGELSAINAAIPRTATVVAVDDVVAVRCPAAALRAACRKDEEVWEALAAELASKIEQRNQLIVAVNERPRIFMIAAERRIEIAKALEIALARDFDVDLWSDEDLVPPGGYQLDILHERARAADFGIVLAHPDDLLEGASSRSDEEWATIRFELGYLMAELTRHRTLVMVPGGADAPPLFKGMHPMVYELPTGDMPLRVALTRAVEQVEEIVFSLKARSRLQVAKR